MAILSELGQRSNRTLPEALVRTIRHEVGDHLQTVYAAVAILQKRLPAEAAVERRVLADLRSRAEECKRLLDDVSDLVSPLSLSVEPADLRSWPAISLRRPLRAIPSSMCGHFRPRRSRCWRMRIALLRSEKSC